MQEYRMGPNEKDHDLPHYLGHMGRHMQEIVKGEREGDPAELVAQLFCLQQEAYNLAVQLCAKHYLPVPLNYGLHYTEEQLQAYQLKRGE